MIGRTPSAVAMKAVNFVHLDPNLNRQGLSSVSKADRKLWDEFLSDSNHIALAAEDLYERRVAPQPDAVLIHDITMPDGPTEGIQEVKVRRVQRLFRNSALTSYENRCAISGLKEHLTDSPLSKRLLDIEGKELQMQKRFYPVQSSWNWLYVRYIPAIGN